MHSMTSFYIIVLTYSTRRTWYVRPVEKKCHLTFWNKTRPHNQNFRTETGYEQISLQKAEKLSDISHNSPEA